MSRNRIVSSLLSCALLALGSAACRSSAVEDPSASPSSVTATPTAIDFGAFEQTLFDGVAKTEGVVVQHQGRLVYEKYAAGYDETKRHLAYSVSKSIGSALLGIAVTDGLMAIEDSICKYVPASSGADPTYCETTIGSLVQMSSGLTWNENYADPATSNILPMLYGDESDMGAYVAQLPRTAATGKAWHYSSGDSNLLARAIRSALGSKNMREWANEKLFVPAGLKSAVFESDRSGTLLFSSGAFLTPRDMARFGQLYLDEGRVGDARVLPPSWVAFTRTPAPAVATRKLHRGTELDERGGSYGASFWLNAADGEAPTDTLLYATAPHDTFCAQGQWGQRICVVPSRKLVIVRVGNDRTGYYDVGPGVAAAVAAVDKVNAEKSGEN